MSNVKFGRAEAAVVYRAFLNNSFAKSEVLSGLKKYSSRNFRDAVAHIDTKSNDKTKLVSNWSEIRKHSRNDDEASVLYNVDRIRSNADTLIVKNDSKLESRVYQPIATNMEHVLSRARDWDAQGRVASNPSSLVISDVTLGMSNTDGKREVVGRMNVRENDLDVVPSARGVLQHMYIVKEPVLREIAQKNGSDMNKYDHVLSGYVAGKSSAGLHFSKNMTKDSESEPVIKATVYNRGLKNQTIDFGNLEQNEKSYRTADVPVVGAVDNMISQSVRKMSKDVQLQRSSTISAEV